MSFKRLNSDIDGLLIIEAKKLYDNRGYFTKIYHKSSFNELDANFNIFEEFASQSNYGVLRGLHFQTKHPQAKLINVIKGRIFDVAVDLRIDSPTYGMHYGLELSSENNLMFFIPAGFAHGFLSLEEETIVSYLCSTEYEPEHDSGIRFDDPDLEIQWPKLDLDYIISEKDLNLPMFRDFKGFNIGNYED